MQSILLADGIDKGGHTNVCNGIDGGNQNAKESRQAEQGNLGAALALDDRVVEPINNIFHAARGNEQVAHGNNNHQQDADIEHTCNTTGDCTADGAVANADKGGEIK